MIGVPFLVSSFSGGPSRGFNQPRCAVAYSSDADSFAVVFDNVCADVCAPVDGGDCFARSVSGQPDGGDDGGQLIGESTSLSDPAGYEEAQLFPAIAYGARDASFLATWRDSVRAFARGAFYDSIPGPLSM